MTGNTHALDSLLELGLSGLHLLLLRTIDNYCGLRERCGVEHLGYHLKLTVLTHLTGKLVFVFELKLISRCAWVKLNLREAILGRVDKRVVHTIHETEIETGNRFALVADKKIDNILLDLSNLSLDTSKNAVYLLRDPYCKSLLDTILIDLYSIGVLQALEQTQCPIVVTQGIINTALALSILSSVDITQDTILTLLEYLLEFVFVNIAHHICLGLVGNPNGTAVVKTTSGVCLDDSLHGSL